MVVNNTGIRQTSHRYRLFRLNHRLLGRLPVSYPSVNSIELGRTPLY
jgi:hypothetical protein